MRDVIANLHEQHGDLQRVAMDLVQILDEGELARDASAARRSLRTLAGILRVHLAMEDGSFYPRLLEHRDPQLRERAERFLAERAELERAFADYYARWRVGTAIEAEPARCIAETRALLLTLGRRMFAEDRDFHPFIVERWERRAG
jgi:hypothetical protein